MDKVDLRVQKTKKVLKNTFKEMFLNMNLEEITVKSLCEKSMINRRTFYLHYNSIDDIMSEIMEDMSNEFLRYTDGYDHFKEIDRIVKDYFEFTNNNPLYEKLNNNTEFDYIRNQINTKVVNNADGHFDSVKNFDNYKLNMTRIFLNSTTVAMYRYWYANKNNLSMDEAIKYTTKLIKNGLNDITKENHLK